MRSETQGSTTRLQYAEDGQVIGKHYTLKDGKTALVLDDGFMWVHLKATGKMAVWDRNNGKAVKLSRNAKPKQLSQNNA